MQNRADDLPRRRRLPAVLAGLGFLSILAVALVGAAGRIRAVPPEANPEIAQAEPAVAPSARAAPAAEPVRFTTVAVRLQKNQTLNQALFSLRLAAAEVNQVVDALRGHFPFRKARPGDQLRIERTADGDLHRFSYRQGAADEWIVERAPDGTLEGTKRPVELTTEVARVAVTIESSLYESLARAEEDPGLAVLAADVLAWDVDFYQDVRNGDRMRILVEKVYADGKLLRYGEVLAAEYDGSATGRKRLFRYTDPAGQTSYFDDEGNSARRGFLKSPLKYAHVTSTFGMRRHPVLGYTRAHEGVDYGAPVGTPIWAVGDGSVRQAGWNGGCGKSVILRHRNGLETIYCHMSQISVSAGKQVSQKQIIGYVGTTGLSTGPHLHYAVKRGGRYMNPMQIQVPREAPVQAAWLPDYREKIAPLRAQLTGPVALN
ncbi:peptidoglycan DD-metalloendopeptidase family protein [Anaeromyxobacter terrae]|uniref:peptidoglycan DD-metalloendopeptidase family protein n=1 Tax=Anaeromyxobacter terrae TaxID=2925406 RepID=UPI001F55D85B|nr:M23 family metallopeptidase [Anaeromyxobacter sp. SG22]